jgi:hypothetical protein
LLVGLALAATGCGKSAEQPPPALGEAAGGAAAKPKPGYEVSLTGYVSKVYDGDQPVCLNATKGALQRLGLKVEDESGGLFKKSFVVEGADGTSVAIQVVEVGRTTCRISVKAGYLLGDRDAALRIQSEIEAELGGRAGEPRQAGSDWGVPAQPAPARAPTPAPPPPPPLAAPARAPLPPSAPPAPTARPTVPEAARIPAPPVPTTVAAPPAQRPPVPLPSAPAPTSPPPRPPSGTPGPAAGWE